MTGHPTAGELIAFAGGESEPPPVAEHVAGCDICAATVRRYRLVRAVVRDDALAVPPIATVERAKQIFASPRHGAATGSGRVRDLLASFRQVVAEVTFDTRGGTLALAGFRGASASGYQIGFAGGGAELDLQVDPPAEPSAPWLLFGQVTTAVDAEAAGVTILLAPTEGGTAVTETMADDFGVFSLAAFPGHYYVLVQLPDSLLVVSELEVG